MDVVCSQPPGVMVPVIDRSRCEAKGDCVQVCPYGVFTIHALSPAEKQPLGWMARVKLLVHGGKQAFATHAEACQACGKCVTACPEGAISLAPGGARLTPPAP